MDRFNILTWAARAAALLLATLTAPALSSPSAAGAASVPQTSKAEVTGQVLRIGGTYKVEAVEKRDDGTFLIRFQSAQASGHFDVLELESDHVHVAVKVGQTLRLSAEIASQQGAVAQVSQLVLFLPNAEGPVPVWLLSNKTPATELRGAKYLEMHSPLNDYVIM